jgi:hypothetical protein
LLHIEGTAKSSWDLFDLSTFLSDQLIRKPFATPMQFRCGRCNSTLCHTRNKWGRRFESARRLSPSAVNKPDAATAPSGSRLRDESLVSGSRERVGALGEANLGLTEGDVCGAKRSCSALVPKRKSMHGSRPTSARNSQRPTTPSVGPGCATSGAGFHTDLASRSGSLRGGLRWS